MISSCKESSSEKMFIELVKVYSILLAFLELFSLKMGTRLQGASWRAVYQDQAGHLQMASRRSVHQDLAGEEHEQESRGHHQEKPCMTLQKLTGSAKR